MSYIHNIIKTYIFIMVAHSLDITLEYIILFYAIVYYSV